jgi:Mg2+-importing ATPase
VFLLRGTLLVAAATLAIPFLGGVSGLFGFAPLSLAHMAGLIAIVAGYAVATEAVKLWFFRRAGSWRF